MLIAALLCALAGVMAWDWLNRGDGDQLAHDRQLELWQNRTGQLPAEAELDAALEALAALPPEVAPTAEIPPYQRAAFGPAWQDTDHNGCDTRNDVLKRDLTQVEFKPRTHDCVVISGVLEDPYTGDTINFVKGNTTSTEVQIDHVIPLKQAWQAGAWAWSDQKRLEFANDFDELLAVSGQANQSKGDKGPANWLPAQNQCPYAITYAQMANRYDLALPGADRDQLTAMLTGPCRQT
ncbi:MAG: HNH endonuclease family protein [Micrococcales bacterium]|nr:HNH endonuclease family protein [Micrococcales bacterium]